jgi:hypothetical protein
MEILQQYLSFSPFDIDEKGNTLSLSNMNGKTRTIFTKNTTDIQ